MMPCKFCSASTAPSPALRGLKQVGKTRYERPRFERRYRCQDCGATCTMRGQITGNDSTSAQYNDEWQRPS